MRRERGKNVRPAGLPVWWTGRPGRFVRSHANGQLGQSVCKSFFCLCCSGVVVFEQQHFRCSCTPYYNFRSMSEISLKYVITRLDNYHLFIPLYATYKQCISGRSYVRNNYSFIPFGRTDIRSSGQRSIVDVSRSIRYVVELTAGFECRIGVPFSILFRDVMHLESNWLTM